MKMIEFADKYNINVESIPVGQVVIDGKTPFNYTVHISIGPNKVEFPFMKGAAHIHKTTRRPIKPTVVEVLDALRCESQIILDFPLWHDYAFEMGANMDSIKDKQIYEKVCENYIKLRDFLGRKIMNELLRVEGE